MKLPPLPLRILVTLLLVAAAIGAAGWKYWAYLTNPWTRDGQVQANVIQITPRVSGPIVDLPIVPNQTVRKGDLLFAIDPRTFAADLAGAEADLQNARDTIAALEQEVTASRAVIAQFEAQIAQVQTQIQAQQATVQDAKSTYDRSAGLIGQGGVSRQRLDDDKRNLDVAQAGLLRIQAQLTETQASKSRADAELQKALATLGAPGSENPQIRAAQARVDTARLNLEFTKVLAPTDGYIANLQLRVGSQAVANQPILALVDAGSYWIHGFFRETLVSGIEPGNRAVVTLMSYPDRPLEGVVESLGWGIARDNGSTGFELLPVVAATFEWIRLAQRVPVRVHLTSLPSDIALRVGTTASVLILGKGTGAGGVPPAPVPLQ
ncbi:MAG: HlyD family secretion protein [Geminicoccaceae bacterium]